MPGHDTLGPARGPRSVDDIAEVIYQDSYEQNPGYFDLTTSKNNGWDPTYANLDYYWYTLGITGLIDAFESAGVHTDNCRVIHGCSPN